MKWEDIFVTVDTNIACETFLNRFILLYANYFPEKHVIILTKTFNNPWIMIGILISFKTKQKLYYKNLIVRNHWSENNHKSFKKLFEAINTKAKKNYYSDWIEKFNNDTRKISNIMKELRLGSHSSNYFHRLGRRNFMNST